MSLAKRWRRWGRKVDLLHLDMQESSPWDPRSGRGGRATLGEALPVRNLRQGSQCPLQAHPSTHAHTGDTLTTLSTPQRGSHSRPSGAPRELGRRLSPQARQPEIGPPFWRPGHPSPGWGKRQPKATGPGGLSHGPAGLPKLAELVTDECRRAGAERLLYPHGGPRAGRQRSPGPVLIVRICGRGHEGAQRAPCLPVPEALDVALWESKHRCESAAADPCPESHPGRHAQPALSRA